MSLLSLEDLEPAEAKLELSTMPGKIIVLKKWSLRARKLAEAKFGGAKELEKMFKSRDIIKIAQVAFILLKNTEDFKTEDDLLENISSPKDQIMLQKAVLQTIGVGEPQMEEIARMLKSGATDPNAMSPSEMSTGAESTI